MKDKKSPRSIRYGHTTRGWDWRTTPERLAAAEEYRKQNGMSKTEMIEKALDELMKAPA